MPAANHCRALLVVASGGLLLAGCGGPHPDAVTGAAPTNQAAPVADTFRVADGRRFTLEPIPYAEYQKAATTSVPILPFEEDSVVLAERRFLQSAAGRVRRSGATLLFKTTRGRVVKLADGRPAGATGSPETYRYLNNLPAVRQWVVAVRTRRSTRYLLVNQAGGQFTQLIGYPEISPDRTRFACANFSKDNSQANGLQLWRKPAGRPPRLLWQRLMAPHHLKWGADAVGWADNRTLVFIQQFVPYGRSVRLRLPRNSSSPAE